MTVFSDVTRGTMPGTWISHGLMCLALSIVGVLAASAAGGVTPIEGGFVGAALGLAFYLLREQRDKRLHAVSAEGYTETNRLDKYGDTVCPAFVWLSWLVALFAERIG